MSKLNRFHRLLGVIKRVTESTNLFLHQTVDSLQYRATIFRSIFPDNIQSSLMVFMCTFPGQETPLQIVMLYYKRD